MPSIPSMDEPLDVTSPRLETSCASPYASTIRHFPLEPAYHGLKFGLSRCLGVKPETAG
jgi:hypothetical protein